MYLTSFALRFPLYNVHPVSSTFVPNCWRISDHEYLEMNLVDTMGSATKHRNVHVHWINLIVVHPAVVPPHVRSIFLSSLPNISSCWTGKRRWAGCKCAHRKDHKPICRTPRCICYKAGRECDPALCLKCDAREERPACGNVGLQKHWRKVSHPMYIFDVLLIHSCSL